jgi:ribA/ribD-fused uncharacterized protein
VENRLTLDNEKQVFFYEQDFYPLSNFSAFRVKWRHYDFDTLEHAYHWEKFEYEGPAKEEAVMVQSLILQARSAHDAFKLAQAYKDLRNPKWDDIKVPVMATLMFAKAFQHEYVQHKLRQLDGRWPIENSWRDAFWGWGPNRDGLNMAGACWLGVYNLWQKYPHIFAMRWNEAAPAAFAALPDLIPGLVKVS